MSAGTREDGPLGRRRALLVTTDFPPTRGGIQTMARELVTRVRSWDMRVVAPADAGFDAVDRDLGVPVRRVRAPVRLGRRAFVPPLALATILEARRSRPHVAVAMHVLAAPGPLLSRLPTVAFVHGGELRSPRIARVARLVLPRARRIVANSVSTRSAAVALGADPARIVVVPVGAPEPIAVPGDRAAAVKRRLGGGRLLLSVGRLAPHKGFERLIRASRELPDDVHVAIVGDGEQRAALETLASAEGVAARVHLLGAVSDDELAALYTAADAFVLLSRSTSGSRAGVEGGGIVLLEALAYGLPVVAAATGGIPETIRDAETGLLVDPDDGSSVVRVLRRILDETDLAGRLAETGHAMATGERSWTNYTQRIETVMDQAADPAT